MGPVTDAPPLERGSPETSRGPAVADPRIRVCSTVVSAAAPCHARSSGGHLASERIGDEHPCPRLLNRDMRVCSTVVSAAVPCHARSSGGHLASERIGDEHPCPRLLNRDMRVDHPAPLARPGLAPEVSVIVLPFHQYGEEAGCRGRARASPPAVHARAKP